MADQNRNITYSVIHLAPTIVENHTKKNCFISGIGQTDEKNYTRERPETYKDSVGQSCKAFEIGKFFETVWRLARHLQVLTVTLSATFTCYCQFPKESTSSRKIPCILENTSRQIEIMCQHEI